MEPTTEPGTGATTQIFGMPRQKAITLGLVIVAFGVLLVLNSRKPELPTPTQNDNTMTLGTPPAPEQEGPTTLTALMAKNIPQECTFRVEDQGVEQYGTVYLAGGKMRLDAQVQTADGTVRQSSMMNDGTYMYVWGDGMPQGIKMPAQDVQGSADMPREQAPAIDQNRELQYDCSPTMPSSNVFALPSDVAFVDLTAMIPASAPPAPNTEVPIGTDETGDVLKATLCAACEQAGDPNGECRKTYKCDE